MAPRSHVLVGTDCDLYGYRARRRGWTVSASTEEAFHNRLDVKGLTRGGPILPGGKQGRMTYRRRNRKS